jgi:glycosyltransferase involved in cell wall biosynthesis
VALVTPTVADPAYGVLSSPPSTQTRPRVRGKFIFAGDDKLYIRGVTYGPFCPDEDGGGQYHSPKTVERDFALMAENGVNAIRTYTVPPRWLLDLALNYGLYVMVGLEWEQHITFLDDKKRARSIEDRIRAGVRACAGHPAVLCYAIGNEIPAPIVRWYGRRRIERFLERLYKATKAEDPHTLVTYVNYPTTEYLQLSFLDFCCFNVYLESQDGFEAYLARLQNLADEKPLVVAETGLDSRRKGEDGQAETLDWQVRTAFASGCAGAFVFAWTDEWHRGGYDIEDWDFGLVRRDRSSKPALATVAKAFAETPFPQDMAWPRISVVVCSYNGARTIRETLKGLQELEYPNYEVIVVSDGCIDATEEITRQYDVRLICTANRGLSSARNTGMEAATGDIVAYIDDDAYPDPHWLHYLAWTFTNSDYAGVGGPNIAPPGDGAIADCVANAPGGPVHVLVSDTEAEHIPGCNMSFWKANLQAVDGFDTQFRIAGDDVDLCWRLQKRGWTLGFHPAAMAWHHRRGSVKAYWRQQLNYGKAEGMLEIKWPEKYNSLGHVNWRGRLYGNGHQRALIFRRWRVYHGAWGSAPFQSLYETAPDRLSSMLQMPEWYLVVAGLSVLSLLGLLWSPLLLVAPLALLAVSALVGQAIINGTNSSFADEPLSALGRLKRYTMTALLYLLQPLARLAGRLHYGLTPWRRRGSSGLIFPRPRTHVVWSERWSALGKRLENIETAIRTQGAVVTRGGDYDRWDMEVRGGIFGALRSRATVEEHGGGKQLIRIRSWPRFAPSAMAFMLLFALLATLAAVCQAWTVAGFLALVTAAMAGSGSVDCATATASFLRALRADNAGRGHVVNDRGERSMASVARDPLRLGMRALSVRPSVGRGSAEGTDPE